MEDSLPCTTKLKQEAQREMHIEGASGQEGMFCDSMQAFTATYIAYMYIGASEIGSAVSVKRRMITAV